MCVDPKRQLLTVFLVNDRFLDRPHGLAVVFDPLDSPLDSLRPPVGVRVECTKIDVLQLELRVKVATISAVVCPVVGHNVETTFAAGSDEVMLVQAPDVRAHLIVPLGDHVRRAAVRARQVAGAVCAAASLVGDLPGHDGRVVLVTGHHCLDVALECLLDLRLAVELFSALANIIFPILWRATNIIVVLSAEVDGVDVHASIVGPVVGQSDDQLHADFAGGVDDFVKSLHIDGGLAVGPALEDDFGSSSSFAAVLW